MKQHHRVIRLVIAFAIGIFLALYSFERISDPEPALQRAREESVVLSARDILKSYVGAETEIEIVDPLATNRSVGKSYVYPTESGWEVSGHYRRYASDTWHPFLMSLDSQIELTSLAVRDDDERIAAAAADDPKFSLIP
jgi:hypothetical protein